MFFEKSEKIFRGFFKRRKPQKGGLGVATPTRFPQDKIERLAKFGTVVESCSKKLRCVVCSLTIRLLAAGLLRSGETFSLNTFSAARRDFAKAAETFSPIPTNQQKAKWTLICVNFPLILTTPHFAILPKIS
ncbi:hypothetical protein AALA36_11270 [Lachnospiraceae bacterium 66-29]